MARVKINLPQCFDFSTKINIQIGDINYGNHLSNDAVLRLCHEVRLRFLQKYHFSEMDIGGCGLIMADASIQYINQAFYGDELNCSVAVTEISKMGFQLMTQMLRISDQKEIARIQNNMVFFDYQKQRIVETPNIWKEYFEKS
ncbi:MAG: thioesterase family protein [Neisseriaceae bacterium]|nr:thioesterase family protein [Neisseriaceae bacterium]